MPYQCIILDPPWPETGGGGRGAQNHYPVIKKKEDILKTIEESGVFNPHVNCHMYLWITNNYLPWGVWLMWALGFDYKTMVTWPKTSRGTGFYFAGQTEHFLFGTRGTLWPRQKAKYTTLLETAFDPSLYEHSVKPIEVHEIAEDIGYTPRLEMFARRPRRGWDCWGRDLQHPEDGTRLEPGFVLRGEKDGSLSVGAPL